MGRAIAAETVPLTPAEALELWADVGRWTAFVDGLARVVEVGERWPAEGSELAWESTPGGRGRVSERVAAYQAPPPGPDVAIESASGQIVTRVRDGSLSGVQTATFAPSPEGTRVELELDYRLARGGPLRSLTDFLFIRRAVRDSLRRTLDRFSAEAAVKRGFI